MDGVAELGPDELTERPHGRRVADVRRVDDDPPAAGTGHVGRLGQLVDAARHADDRVPSRGQGDGNAATQAPSGAGDDRHAVTGKRIHVGLPPRRG